MQHLNRFGIAAVFVLSGGTAFGLSPSKDTYSADVVFAHQSVNIENTQLTEIEDIVCSSKNVNLEVLIAVGHADKSESDRQKLSEARALSVKLAFVERGIPANRIFVIGKADSQPLKCEDSIKNMRVEVELMGTRNSMQKSIGCNAAVEASR